MEKPIAKRVHAWIRERPYLVWALKRGFVNFSSLARAAQQELNVKNFDAVIVAARRFGDEATSDGKNIISLLKNSRLEIKTGVNVYILKSSNMERKTDYLHVIKGSNATTVITEEPMDIPCMRKNENMLEVRIISPAEIENNTGFMAYVCSALAERGINIQETYSCYTDTIFIFAKKDMTRVVETLESIGIR
ncbi:MAG: ACT domain-containing protein [Candidatus Aenigmarchaeota archaeon]|nr:ACT domain-containing protein [Candidatus Aenigmarchaeota archaeon]